MLATGEDLPSTQSILARLLTVEVEKGTVDTSKLTEAQNQAHRLSHAMAGYIEWLVWGKGRGLAQIYEKEEIVLTRAEPDQRGTFRFRICDQLPSEEEPSADCKLIIQINGLTAGDQLVVEINSSEIPSSDLHWDLKSDPPSCSLHISAPRFHYGDNHLCVTLMDSTTSEGTISIERLDCYVP